MSRKGDKHWTRMDCQRLRMFWPSYPRAEIVRMFPQRTWDAIGQQAKKLKIRRKWKWGGKRQPPKDDLMAALRSAREDRDWSAYQLGREIGTDGRWVAKCERGAAGPSYHMLTRWCAALGVQLKIENITPMRGQIRRVA